MAQRDKSQGFGFVYVDLKELLAQRDELYSERFHEPVHARTDPAKKVLFSRDRVPAGGSVLKAPEGKRAPLGDTTKVSLEQIRENLDRLQALHHKLHAVLEELSTATDRTTPERKK